MDIWAACREAAVPGPLEGELVRIVESQEKIATNAIVESLEEQALLEELLDPLDEEPLLLEDPESAALMSGGRATSQMIAPGLHWLISRMRCPNPEVAVTIRSQPVSLAASMTSEPMCKCRSPRRAI